MRDACTIFACYRRAAKRSALLILLVAVLGLAPPGAAAALPSVVPTRGGTIGPISVEAETLSATFRVQTADGVLHYNWKIGESGAGELTALAGPGETLVAAGYKPVWAGRRIAVVSSSLQSSGRGAVLTQVVTVDGIRANVTATAQLIGGSLVLDFACDQPLISALQFAPLAGFERFMLPYDPVPMFRTTGSSPIYASAFFDWTASGASRIGDDGAAEYAAKTDNHRNPVSERLVFTASSRIHDILPNPAWGKSRFYDRVGGRIVIDVTVTALFGEIETGLDGLIRAGLSDCVFIVHVWQKLGYDNGLPVVLPANGYFGGPEILRRIGGKAKAAGCEFALHQNYVDSYTNSGEFDPAKLSVETSGQAVKAWFNPAVKAQSFALKPGLLASVARRHATEIRADLGTTASFVDVNSGVVPWHVVDMDARDPEGGRFRGLLAGTKALYETMQEVEQGPAFGEGHDHAFWTGALDGVEAQLTVGRSDVDVRRVPFWVDFDLVKMAPFQRNFGMGFYGRYAPATAVSPDPMTVEQTRDIYRTQQLAFGHSPYRSDTLWADPRLFIQEAGLAVPVARSYAASVAREITYPIGSSWGSIEAALPSGPAKAVRVRYANGLTITANSGTASIKDDRGQLLAAGSWSARGKDIDGWSTIRGKSRDDVMVSPRSIYADPRGAAGNWQPSSGQTPAPTDFGSLRTNGQTWLHCDRGNWTVIGFAKRGFVDLEVRSSVVAPPAQLIAATGSSLSPHEVRNGFWRVRLESGASYSTTTACGA